MCLLYAVRNTCPGQRGYSEEIVCKCDLVYSTSGMDET